MSTRTAISWLLASLFAASSGCLSLDQSGTFSSLDLRSKRGAAQPTFASEDLPRFRSPGKPADTPSQDTSGSVASFETSPSDRKFDATTMALIESELRDSDPADRKEWLEYLSSVEPEVVPHLLKARRLELNQRRETGGDSSPTALAQSNAPVSAPDRDEIDPISGKSPWDRAGDEADVTVAAAESDEDDAVVKISHTEVPLQSEPGALREEPDSEAEMTAETEQETAPPWARKSDDEPAGAGEELMRTVSAGPDRESAETLDVPDADPLTERFSQIVEERREKPVEDRPFLQESDTPEPEVAADPFEELSPTRMRPATKFSEDELLRLISLLEAETAQLQPGTSEGERARYIRAHVQLRLLYWMTDQPDRAMQAIPGLEAAEQTYWTNTIWALSDYFDTQETPDRAARMSQVLDRLVEAAGSVEAHARLQLLNATFCRKIDGFGRVTTFGQDEFRAGQPVLVYAELARFGSELTDDGQYRTRIGSVIEIFRKGEREPVHRIEMDPTVDLCGTRRHDYFHSYWIDLPAELQSGPHELRLRVVDELTGQHATTSLPFRVVD